MGYQAIYDKTIFHDSASGFCILSMKTADQGVPEKARSTYKYRDHLIRFTATGYGLPRTDAVKLVLEGEWENTKHGTQLKVECWEEILPKTTEGIRGYLASGLIKGIGSSIADAIVNRFGADSLTVMEKQPERLLEIRGITEQKLVDIRESYLQSSAVRDLVTFLSPFKVTPKTAQKIYEEFGAESADIIRKQPFKLCRISGFGFKRVDVIARQAGCKPNDPLRIRGALFYVLDDSCSRDGHLYLPKDELCQEALTLLNEKLPLPQMRLKMVEVTDVLLDVVTQKEVISEGGVIYTPRCYGMEDFVARRVAEMLSRPAVPTEISAVLSDVKTKFGISLSRKQEDAVSMVFQHDLSIITGSPGTGKTTVLKAIIEVFQKVRRDGRILLAAPTGRASRKMAESTGFSEAKTLHSALGLYSGDDEDSHLNNTEPIKADLVVIDEFSMVDMWLASELFSRISQGTKILMVGDADQLPSVGAGNVFRELISCGQIPVTVLDEIFRQSKDSLIAHNAKLINSNKTRLYEGNDFVIKKCETPKEAAFQIQQLYLERIQTDGVENVQIITPFRENGEASANKLNAVIRELVNPPEPGLPEIRAGMQVFRQGDRVMQIKNKHGISNGDMGFIRAVIPGDEPKVTIEFTDTRTVEYASDDLGIIEHAYAATVHKAMGSEYDTVIFPILSAHMVMLYRNLIYTAVTRAKKRVFLVGQRSALCLAIHRCRIDKRNTQLGSRIQEYREVFLKQQAQLKLTG